MIPSWLRPLVALVIIGGAVTLVQRGCAARSANVAVSIPAPALDPRSTVPLDTAVLAGGCFWGLEAVYEHVKGVKSVVSGYTGGDLNAPTYNIVSSGMTGHAESVLVVYDPRVVSYGTLLEVFFGVAHDPTTLNSQGPDRGTQYRSAIFYRDSIQQRTAESYVAQLDRAHAFDAPIVTQVQAAKPFYAAEDYHQHYFDQHPYAPYIMINDAPKVARLHKQLSALWVDR